MKSKFVMGKKLNITTKQNLRHKIDQFLSAEYEHLKHQKTLKPSNVDPFFSCGSKNNNDMIMDYVRTLYDQYKIPDPLLQPSKIIKSNIPQEQPHSTITQTPPKKIVYNSIIDQRTHKKGISNISRMQTQLNSHLHPDNKRDRRTVSFLFSTAKKNENSQQPTHQNSQIRYGRKISTISLRKQQKQPLIEESYRYCIGCEEAVLTGNMKNHELICEKYSRIYSMQLHEILSYLQDKINQIRQRTKITSQKLTQQDPQSMRLLTENMYEESEGINRHGKISSRFTKNYHEAIDIGRRWAHTSEQINKLRWFLRIREQIKKRFDY